MPNPPSNASLPRPSGFAQAQANSSAPRLAPSTPASGSLGQPVAAAKSDGKSCPAGSSTATASTVATRSTAVSPFSVAKALRPSTVKTTSDFRLPPPRRTSARLPQPDASTMPKPNIAPPTSIDSHIRRGAA